MRSLPLSCMAVANAFIRRCRKCGLTRAKSEWYRARPLSWGGSGWPCCRPWSWLLAGGVTDEWGAGGVALVGMGRSWVGDERGVGGLADRAFADVAEAEDAEQWHFDFAGTAEKLEQDGHSFAGGHDAGHGTGDPSERTVTDFHFIAGDDGSGDDQGFITGDGDAQLIDHAGGDSGHGMAEVDLAGDATGG